MPTSSAYIPRTFDRIVNRTLSAVSHWFWRRRLRAEIRRLEGCLCANADGRRETDGPIEKRIAQLEVALLIGRRA